MAIFQKVRSKNLAKWTAILTDEFSREDNICVQGAGEGWSDNDDDVEEEEQEEEPSHSSGQEEAVDESHAGKERRPPGDTSPQRPQLSGCEEVAGSDRGRRDRKTTSAPPPPPSRTWKVMSMDDTSSTASAASSSAYSYSSSTAQSPQRVPQQDAGPWKVGKDTWDGDRSQQRSSRSPLSDWKKNKAKTKQQQQQHRGKRAEAMSVSESSVAFKKHSSPPLEPATKWSGPYDDEYDGYGLPDTHPTSWDVHSQPEDSPELSPVAVPTTKRSSSQAKHHDDNDDDDEDDNNDNDDKNSHDDYDLPDRHPTSWDVHPRPHDSLESPPLAPATKWSSHDEEEDDDDFGLPDTHPTSWDLLPRTDDSPHGPLPVVTRWNQSKGNRPPPSSQASGWNVSSRNSELTPADLKELVSRVSGSLKAKAAQWKVSMEESVTVTATATTAATVFTSGAATLASTDPAPDTLAQSKRRIIAGVANAKAMQPPKRLASLKHIDFNEDSLRPSKRRTPDSEVVATPSPDLLDKKERIVHSAFSWLDESLYALSLDTSERQSDVSIVVKTEAGPVPISGHPTFQEYTSPSFYDALQTMQLRPKQLSTVLCYGWSTADERNASFYTVEHLWSGSLLKRWSIPMEWTEKEAERIFDTIQRGKPGSRQTMVSQLAYNGYFVCSMRLIPCRPENLRTHWNYPTR